MADSIKLDTTVPAYEVARGSLVHFDIFLKETERQQLSARFAFIFACTLFFSCLLAACGWLLATGMLLAAFVPPSGSFLLAAGCKPMDGWPAN